MSLDCKLCALLVHELNLCDKQTDNFHSELAQLIMFFSSFLVSISTLN